MLKTNISVMLTTKCTLNCRFCSLGIPYYNKPVFFPKDFLLENIKRLLVIYDESGINIAHIDLLGGEPLLHPDLEGVLKGLCTFDCALREVRILTNSTIAPTIALLESIKNVQEKMRFLFILADYGELSVYLMEWVHRLEEFDIAYRIDSYTGDKQYFGGWVSYGADGSVGEKRTQERYDECAFCHSGVTEVCGSFAYPCTKALALMATGRKQLLSEEYIDLNDEMTVNIQKMKAFISRRDAYAICEECTGLSDAAVRYPAAEQMRGGNRL